MRIAYARQAFRFLAGCTLLCASALPVLADAWKPEKNVEIVVAGGPGGGTDQLARLIQLAISQHNLLDVNTVVLNKGGGNGAEAFLDMKLANGDAHHTRSSDPSNATGFSRHSGWASAAVENRKSGM